MLPNSPTISQIYTENPTLKKQDVDTIFTWLQTQPHLPHLTEFQIILFLHSCYHETEATKTTIENYFILRTSSSLFQSGNEEQIRRVFSSFFIGILPKQTPEGFVVLLVKILDSSPDKFVCDEVIKMLIMVVCLNCHQNGLSNGLVILYDSEGTGFGHLFKMSLTAVRQVLQFLQEAAPTRLRNIHYINAVPVLKPLIALAKPFMKREIAESMIIHTRYKESLYGYIPKECLPEEYGGELGPMMELHDKNVENVVEQHDFFEWHDGQRVDETKRAVKERGFFGNLHFFGK
ncbi:hypothetical protein Zmor_008073 [Zophobas morio]|uniref:CRAL-TRIO domain-containing protein n=3 Tax=Zophobas morio TaxID=2755281 RepID=A0AA38J1R1_9CUCU|nr:hypothetical protein Zmor_008073 [Zophobas morio]